MQFNSVNTNASALLALQNLNATNSDLNTTQTRVSTGLKVSSAKDDGATWAIAQNQRAAIGALGAVTDSLNRVSSAVDVAMTAGETVSDLLTQMKEKALAASDANLDTASRDALNDDFTALRDQISKVVSNADFNGMNLLKSGATDATALADANGTSVLTVQAQSMALSGAIVTITSTSDISSSTDATAMLSLVNASITNVSSALAKLGTASNAVDTHKTFISKLSDTLETGVGNLVDADLAKESAKLTALQTKQQLGVQALSIANSAPQVLLSLFNNQ